MSESNDQPIPRTAMPQRIGPESTPNKHRKPRGNTLKRLTVIVASLALLAALVLAALFAYDQLRGPTDEDLAETAIENYMAAVERGELDDLRASTCGTAREYYDGLTPAEFTSIYDASRDSIPIIDSIERIEITENRALAEVTAHTAARAEKTVRTVGLERVGDEWKVCDAPTGP